MFINDLVQVDYGFTIANYVNFGLRLKMESFGGIETRHENAALNHVINDTHVGSVH